MDNLDYTFEKYNRKGELNITKEELDILLKLEKEPLIITKGKGKYEFDKDAYISVLKPRYTVTNETNYSSEFIDDFESLDDAVDEAVSNNEYQEEYTESLNSIKLSFKLFLYETEEDFEKDMEYDYDNIELYEIERYISISDNDKAKQMLKKISQISDDIPIYSNNLSGSEIKTQELLYEVMDGVIKLHKKEYNLFNETFMLYMVGSGKYRKFEVYKIINEDNRENYDEDDIEEFSDGKKGMLIDYIELRIADHTHNPQNVKSEHFISVVIRNNDPTENKFLMGKWHNHSIYFNDEYTSEEVVSSIESEILDIIANEIEY
jgi:hypothetical protein